MKTYKYLWDTFISDETIKLAIHNASKGNKQPKTKRALKKMMEQPSYYIPKIRYYAEHFRNGRHKPIEIYDGISRKKRTIIVPNPYEQVIHHMLVITLKPMFMRSMYQHTYGSVPKRGGVHGMKQLKKWLPTKYVLQMDIRKYFDNVDQDILIAKLKRKIKDDKIIRILEIIIRVAPKGIPLGFYTSQWFANFYLTDLDHYITNTLSCGKYERYMDDMVICGNNKRKLHKVRIEISKYLADQLRLEMKGNWQVYRFDYLNNGVRKGRRIDFMGFLFYRDRVILRESIMLKASSKARKIHKKQKCTWYDAAQLLSYNGWFKHTDTHNMMLVRIYPYVSMKEMKKKVSEHSKRLNTWSLMKYA